MTHDIAIAHKDYDVRGGGEVLAEELARCFDAPMYVGRRDEQTEPEQHSLSINEIDLTRWQRWAIDAGGPARSMAYMIAWQQVPQLTEYDTVITSGNEAMWYVPEDDQTLVAYTHSTPRFAYDLFQEHDYGLLKTAYNTAVRTLYQHNVTRPDHYVANSDVVARRINQYWDIPKERIDVVYPPVNTRDYSPKDAETGDEYLYLGRLAGHKCVDEVVAAFNDLGDDYQLVIAGCGPEGDALRKQAGENVDFLGFVDEATKRELYARAKALVYPPQNEDFGMVPVESMAAGTPVIGVEEGFTKYQIQDTENGLTWKRGKDSLCAAIEHFEENGVFWGEQEIAEFARENFSIPQFRDGMRAAVEKAQQRAAVEPEFDTPDGAEAPVDERLAERLAADGGEP